MNLRFTWSNEAQRMVGAVSSAPTVGRLVEVSVVDGVIHGVFDTGTFRFSGPVSIVGLEAVDVTNWCDEHRWELVGCVTGKTWPQIQARGGASPRRQLLAAAAYDVNARGVQSINVDPDRRDAFLSAAKETWLQMKAA